MHGYRRRLIYNNEGYLDLTAFIAIKNVYKKGGYCMSTWKDGDIIKMVLPDGREVYRVIIKAHERYATTLTLFDSECFENEYQVKIDNNLGKFHADTGKIAFTKNWDLDEAEFVRAMGESEFDKLLAKIGESIGIPTIPSTGEDINELKEKAEKAAAENDALAAENDRLKKKVSDLDYNLAQKIHSSEEQIEKLVKELDSAEKDLAAAIDRDSESKSMLIKAEAERDVYKDLYMRVMGSMIPAGAN